MIASNMISSKEFYISNWLVMAISIPDRTWIISQSIQDTDKRLRYLEAIIMYRMEWSMSEDKDIAPLVTATLWNVERIKKISNSMKGNSNAKKGKTVKTDKNRLKQIGTDWDSSKQIKTDEKIEVKNLSSELAETVKTDENSSGGSVLYNNINNKNITSDINYLIQELKDLTKELWIAYENKNERNFAKHILTAKDFWEFAEWIWQSRVEFAKNILRASVVINYRKWPCSWPMSIYQNYSEVYNKARQQQQNRTVISIPTV